MKLATLLTSLLLASNLCIANDDSVPDRNQIWVITGNQNLQDVSKKQLKQIYMNNGINFSAKPINLSSGKARSIFNAKIIGLTNTRIKSYWAQMKFTGRANPPLELENPDKVIKFLEENPDYIAYVPNNIDKPESLSIIYTISYRF